MFERGSIAVCGLALALAAGCAGPRGSGEARRPLGELERRTRLVDTASGREVALDAAIDRLAGFDAVFFGETHVDETTHRLQLAVYEGLLEATGGRVVLAMEMFARDAQPALDAYLAGAIDEPAFLERSSPWSNYATAYRPMVELARERGLPVVGSNVPAALRSKVSRGEAAAFAALSDAERAWIAPELLPNSPAYWQRFLRIVRAPAGQTADPADYLYTGQSLWDNTMGFSCAEALEAHPGWLVFHVNGRFHTDYGQGTADQLRLRRPGARVATVTATAVEDVAGLALEPEGGPPEADIVAYVESRGRGVQDGSLAVRTGHTRRFRLHVPEGASAANPVPLLIWLTRDDVSMDDELEFWKLALGDEAAVAVLEPTYRALAPDLGPGGTWIHVETTSADVSDGIAAAREVRRYVERYFPVDSERVHVSGAATGGTVAAAGALSGEFESASAYQPERFRRLRIWGLPEPGGSARSLRLSWGADSKEWWERELSDYAASGLEGSVVNWDCMPLARRGLGLSSPYSQPSLPPQDLMPYPPRMEVWHTTVELAHEAGLQVPRFAVDERLPLDLADGTLSGLAIPVPEGPFGGTTVVVAFEDEVRPEQLEAWRAAWQALDGADLLKVHGGFHELRVAFQGGSPSPSEVLSELHRKNVLIVPGSEYAWPSRMNELRAEVSSQLQHMTYAFLPGLGGRLHLGAKPR